MSLAIEAYRMCGWSTTYKYLKIIWDDYKLVRAESRKDDTIDADNDGEFCFLKIHITLLKLENHFKINFSQFLLCIMFE